MDYFKSMNEYTQTIGLRHAAAIPFLYYSEESEACGKGHLNGVYIGKGSGLSSPVFLDLQQQINPHVMIAGITGAGKSFLVKAVVPRIASMDGVAVLIVDFAGEYGELARTAGAKAVDFKGLSAQAISQGVTIADLSSIRDDAEKTSCAESAVSACISAMRSFPADSKLRLVLVLDEAWKLMKSGNLLEVLIREGRKYGVSVVIATQMLDDMAQGLFENMGTVFVFRLQNTESLDRLSRNYNLAEEHVSMIQNLGLGACMLIRVFKSKRKVPVFIERVEQVRVDQKVCVQSGGMEIEIKERSFYSGIEGIVERSRASELRALLEKERVIRLESLLDLILSYGADRRKTLSVLRSFGLPEAGIADAFAKVCGNGSSAKK